MTFLPTDISIPFRAAADMSNFDFDGDEDEVTPSTTPRRPPGASRLTGLANRELKGSGPCLKKLICCKKGGKLGRRPANFGRTEFRTLQLVPDFWTVSLHMLGRGDTILNAPSSSFT
jgi:hypothetical protein